MVRPFSAGCDTIGLPLPNFLFMSIIGPTLAAIVLFILILAKTYTHVRRSSKESPMMALLLRDGVSKLENQLLLMSDFQKLLYFGR